MVYSRQPPKILPSTNQRTWVWWVFFFPGSVLQWWEYMQPNSVGNSFGTARRLNSRFFQFLTTMSLYLALAVFAFLVYTGITAKPPPMH
jgi:hypothetical protein